MGTIFAMRSGTKCSGVERCEKKKIVVTKILVFSSMFGKYLCYQPGNSSKTCDVNGGAFGIVNENV